MVGGRYINTVSIGLRTPDSSSVNLYSIIGFPVIIKNTYRNNIIYTWKVHGFHFYLWVGTILLLLFITWKKSFYTIYIIFRAWYSKKKSVSTLGYTNIKYRKFEASEMAFSPSSLLTKLSLYRNTPVRTFAKGCGHA